MPSSIIRSRFVATDAEPEARFFGDPGSGKVLTGATVFTGGSEAFGGGTPTGVSDGNDWMDDNTGVNHVLKRIYYSGPTEANSNMWERSTIQSYHNAGKIPSIAWRLDASSANIAALAGGSRDADITTEANWAASTGYMIWTAFQHEPEDNYTTEATAANYRATYRRYRNIFRDAGADNVVFVGIAFQTRWTFDAAGISSHGGLQWWHWDPDWKGTLSGSGGTIPNASDWWTGADAVQDIMSHDVYCPTINATTYREFGTFNMQTAINAFNAAGREVLPWVVLEWGAFTRMFAADPPPSGMPGDGWTGYFQRAMRYMRDNNGVGYVYYNTNSTNFINASEFAERRAAYEDALASEASYLVTERPS